MEKQGAEPAGSSHRPGGGIHEAVKLGAETFHHQLPVVLGVQLGDPPGCHDGKGLDNVRMAAYAHQLGLVLQRVNVSALDDGVGETAAAQGPYDTIDTPPNLWSDFIRLCLQHHVRLSKFGNECQVQSHLIQSAASHPF